MVTIAAFVGLVAVSATGVQKTYGATTALPPVPVCGFNFTSQYAPSAGAVVAYTLSFTVCKSLKLSVELLRPRAVRKATANHPKADRYVHGNPVWIKKVYWRDYPTKTLHLKFANNLQTGQKVQIRFRFSAPGYRPDYEVTTQTVYNP